MTADNSAPASSLITTSWTREDLANGFRRFKLYAIQVPVMHAAGKIDAGFLEHNRPRLGGTPVVVGESLLEAVNLEVARLMLSGLNEMLRAQPAELIRVRE